MNDDRAAFGLVGEPPHMTTIMSCDRTMVDLLISAINFTKVGETLGEHDLLRGEKAVGQIMGVPLAVPTDLRSHYTLNFSRPTALKLAIAAATTAFEKLADWAEKYIPSPEQVTSFIDKRKAAAQEAIRYIFESYSGSRWRLRRLGKLLKPSTESKTVFDLLPVSTNRTVRLTWRRKRRRNDPFQAAAAMVKSFGHPELCKVLADRDKEAWSDDQFGFNLVKKTQEIRENALSTWQVGEITPSIADDFGHRFRESHQKTFNMVSVTMANLRRKADEIRGNQDAELEDAITNAANAAEIMLGKAIDKGWFKAHRQWEADVQPEVSKIIEKYMRQYNAKARRDMGWLLDDLKILEAACGAMSGSTAMTFVVREEPVKLKAPSVYVRALAAADKAAGPVLLGSGIAGALILAGTIPAAPLVLPAVGAGFVATLVYRIRSRPAQRKANYVDKLRNTIVADLKAKSASGPAFRSKTIGEIEKRAQMLSSELMFRTNFEIENEARSMMELNILKREWRNQTIASADNIMAALPVLKG